MSYLIRFEKMCEMTAPDVCSVSELEAYFGKFFNPEGLVYFCQEENRQCLYDGVTGAACVLQCEDEADR